jgi:serine/threonine protein kinase
MKIFEISSTDSENIKKEYDLMKKYSNKCDYLVGIKDEDIFELELKENKKFLAFIMEFCEGGSLDNKIKSLRSEKIKVELAVLLSWSVEIFRGLLYLHENDIIHRDIKPGYDLF